MISHEDSLQLPEKILKKYGFTQLHNSKHVQSHRKEEYGYDPGYTHMLRVHDDQYFMYDINGFITYRRAIAKKRPGGGNRDALICIPKPIRTETDLKKLIFAISFSMDFQNRLSKAINRK